MATFTDFAFDPVTGQTTQKKPQALPYLNPNEANQGYLPYKPPTQPQLSQGNDAVMGQAQQMATQQPASAPIQQQTTKMTQDLMTNPNMGRDWTAYNKGMISKFDLDRASTMKAAKEAMPGMGGSGQVQENLIKMALGQNVDRAILENELEQQAYKDSLNNYLTALGAGQTQGQYLDQSTQAAINNLLNVRGAYEPQRAQEFGAATEKELLGMQLGSAKDIAGMQLRSAEDIAKWEIASGEKMTADKITSSEKIAGMDIASREKIASDQNYLTQQGIDLESAQLYGYDSPDGTHIYGQAELAGMKFGLEEQTVENQTRELFGGMVDTNGDGIADKQIFGKYDLLSNEDKREADKLYGYEMTDANGNIIGHVSGTLQLEADRVEIERQGLEIEEAKIYGYDKADGTHVDGQLEIAAKQYGIDLERLGIEKGALELQVERFAVEKALAALEERRVDIAGIESTYNLIASEVEAGRAAPGDALDYINFVLEKNGVSLQEADKNAIFDEVAQDFKVQQFQFALANPDMGVFNSNGDFVGLNEEGNHMFGNYVSSTFYGEAPTVGGMDLEMYGLTDMKTFSGMSPADMTMALRNADDPTNKNYQTYQKFVASAPTISPHQTDTRKNHLELGANEGDVVNSGGRLLVITKGKHLEGEKLFGDGRKRHEFEVMDIATGTRKTFNGFDSGDNSVNNFDAWVASLA